MAHILTLLLLALAVSLDSFSVGFTYGLRNMKISIKSIIIIGACSAAILILAMIIGHFVESFFSPKMAEKLGGSIFILIGGWILYQFFRPEKSDDRLYHEKIIFNFEIKSLGIVINILKKPLTADFDRSGTINGIEAVMLGLALSLDAFGAGIGAAMLGFSPIYLALAAAVMSTIFVYSGTKLGHYFSGSEWMQRFSFIPGILLIILGVLKL